MPVPIPIEASRDAVAELLAIDLGTMSAKVGVFARDGRLVGFARHPYPLEQPGPEGWVEQQPEQWWTAVQGAIHEALRGHSTRTLKAICAGGQGPTLVLVDRDGDPVRPAISWMDARAAPYGAALSERLQTPHASYSLVPRLQWVAENEPRLYERTHRALQAWDFIGHRLTGGEAAAASTIPGDAVWPAAWLEAAGLTDSAPLPPHVDAGAAYGQTDGPWAAAAGLPHGIPVVGGLNDGIGSIVGASGNVVGRATDPGGAAGGFALCWDRPLEAPGVDQWPGLTPGTHIVGGAFVAGGRALNWWSAIADHDDLPRTVGRAALAPPGSDRLVFLPFLAGERAPLWDADVRGAFVGLSFEHGPEHLSRAVLEGTGYALRRLIEPIVAAGGRIDELRVCGGPAQSALWNQIKADVTGYPVAVPRLTEVALMGNAIYAAIGAGFYADVVSAGEAMVRIAETLEPRPAARHTYEELFAVYKRAYPTLKQIWAGGQ